MKKITFLLSLVFAFFWGGITASAQVQLGEALDRSTWSVSASSWCYDTGKIGNITDIKDGKTDTYWHSNWMGKSGTGIGGSLPEYFIVDLGEVKDISGFGYVPRNGGNGQCTSYKVYVSETQFDDVAIPATDASHKDAVKNKTGEVKAGTMSWSGGYKQTDVAFDTNVMGRYVLFVTLDSDGQDPHKWASCSEFYVYEAYNTKAGLSKEIKELQYVVDNSGVNPGQYKAANSAAIATAIAKAQAVLNTEGATMTQYGEALNTLKAETNGLVVVNPLEAGYYMIVSGFQKFKDEQGVEKAMYAKAGAPAWKTLNQKDGTQYWQLKAVEGGFALYNLGREKYISGVGALGDETVLTFDNLTTPGDFNIKKGSDVFHALGHNGGAGNEGDITSWGGNSGTASAWVLRKVNYEDIEALKPAFAAEARKPIMAAIAKVDVNALNGVNPGQIADPQALDEVKNLVTTSTANANAETNVKALLDMEGTFKTASAALLTQHCNKIDTKKYYRIKNKKYGHYIGWKEGTSNTVKMNDDDKAAVDQLWQFVESNGKFKLLNVNAGTYLANVAGGKGNTSGLNAGGADYTVSLSDAPAFEILDGGKPVQEEVNQNLNWWYDNDGNAKWYLIEATDIEVALNNAGDASYATTYLPFSVSAAEGAELYTGELNGNEMNLTKSHTGVAAEQGIVLVGESSATKAVLTIGEGTATGKGLVGTLTPKAVEASSVLTLGKSGSEVGFFAFIGTQIGANKAYVEKPAGASAVMINFGEVTGIENAVAPEAANAPLYDLSGRRVVKAVKGGLYIQNGKKFIAR